MMPLPYQVTISALATQASLELSIRLMILQDYDRGPTQANVQAIIEVADEALMRGMHTGLLLPLTWAAACASGSRAKTVDTLLARLQENYHLEHGLMDRLVHFPWRDFEGISYDQWDDFLKQKQVWVPLF